MDIEGSVKLIAETQTFGSGFQKREFVITTKEQYPQDVKFELVKDRIDLIDAYKSGDQIKVHFNVRGNEYNGKYFVNLQAWRIEPLSGSAAKSTPAMDADPFGDVGLPEEPLMSNDADDLPF
jgi:single-strand DNA-binding protein